MTDESNEIPSFKEALIFQGIAASIAAQPGGEIATISVTGAQPILVHLPMRMLPLLRRQIDEALRHWPPLAEQD